MYFRVVMHCVFVERMSVFGSVEFIYKYYMYIVSVRIGTSMFSDIL